jgi:hypothetical protein
MHFRPCGLPILVTSLRLNYIIPKSTGYLVKWLNSIVNPSTQNNSFNNCHVGVYRTSVDELLLFHQLKRNFNHFDKFYLKARKFPRFSKHECNAHFCVPSISSLTSWDVTQCQMKGSKERCIVKCGGDTKISNVKRAIKRNTHVEIDGVSATDKKSMTNWS